MTNESFGKPKTGESPKPEQFDAAITHVDQALGAGHIAASAAKGILFSVIETLGVLVGDPDLPSHARSGYEALLERARELDAQHGESEP